MATEIPFDEYPHPFVTVDVLIFTVREGRLNVALVKRGIEPFKGSWALPGGFVRSGESLEGAATRELEEEVGITGEYLEQLYTFGDLDRDPRARVITVGYYALVPSDRVNELEAGSDASLAEWFCADGVPDLAFDHARILATAVGRVRTKLEYSSIAYALLPKRFSLADLQNTYEAILGRGLDKRNFRKKILSLGVLELTDERSGGAHRPAALYSFKERAGLPFDAAA